MARPSMTEAIAAKLAKSTADSETDFDKVLALAKDNPAAFAELPEAVRRDAALHATRSTPAGDGQGDGEGTGAGQ